MKTVHFVSHTHWDREWYQPHQEFRFRLVKMMDQLLPLLDDGTYEYFTLDGQTIVLDDYLEIRPEEEPRLRRLIQDGKLLIGPWYILPDEFLEGPEAMVRNLLFGRRACRRFTPHPQPMERMCYIPDTFGHIGQLAQIAAGFDQESVCFWRGVGSAPTELRWAAPDGTERLLLHLRDSYSNGADLERTEEGFARDLAARIDSLAPHTPTSQVLIMFGTDHMEARPELPHRLRAASQALGVCAVQSTLPRYLAAVQAELGANGPAGLDRRQGEMRSPERAHLLPGVLSTRTWIKQRNSRCETLLTRWAEPFSALAEQLDGRPGRRAFVRKSWQWLLQNHPHDSICGCSIDQVHEEMRARFDWSEQIAEQVTRTSQAAIAEQVDTRPPAAVAALQAGSASAAIVVFNPMPEPRSGRARVRLAPAPQGPFALVDGAGEPAPYRVVGRAADEKFGMLMPREMLAALLAQVVLEDGRTMGDWFFQSLDVQVTGATAFMEIAVANAPSGIGIGSLPDALARLQALLADPTIEAYQVRAVGVTEIELELLARDVPGLGYRTYWPAAGQTERAEAGRPAAGAGPGIENELLRIEADATDGTLAITDKVSGLVMRGVNRFVDGGDRGDEYNYTAPEDDRIVDRPLVPPVITRIDDGLGQALDVEMVYRLPRSLADGDRSRRSEETADVTIGSRVWLLPGARRVDIETRIGNCAEDHRLRVHVQTSIATGRVFAEGHYDVVERPVTPPGGRPDWAEQPVGNQPQLGFVDVSDGQRGVMLINLGLPEYEAIPARQGEAAGVTLALTLLRCVGWLSRGDLHNRKGHAGPALATPGAQCPGEHRFHYALLLHDGGYMPAQREAAAFAAGLRAVSTPIHDGRLPASSAFVSVTSQAVALSAIKAPEEGEGLIVRVYNTASEPVEARLQFWRPFHEVALVRLDEGGTPRVVGNDADAVTMALGAKQIATLRLT